MRILLVSDAPRRDGALQALLEGGAHRVRHALPESLHGGDLRDCDLVVLDATAADAAAQRELVSAAHRLRDLARGRPVLVVSAPAEGRAEPAAPCRIRACGDGVLRVSCRLQELAWAETEALVREALERPSEEPIVFEYRGT